MKRFDEETLAMRLRELRPPPRGWVEAAQELPLARQAIDRIVERAVADAAYRAEVLAGLEQALETEGIEPHQRLVAELRGRLAGSAE